MQHVCVSIIMWTNGHLNGNTFSDAKSQSFNEIHQSMGID